jgi:hypothetical protein
MVLVMVFGVCNGVANGVSNGELREANVSVAVRPCSFLRGVDNPSPYEGDIFLRNVGNDPQDYMASQPKTRPNKFSPP